MDIHGSLPEDLKQRGVCRIVALIQQVYAHYVYHPVLKQISSLVICFTVCALGSHILFRSDANISLLHFKEFLLSSSENNEKYPTIQRNPYYPLTYNDLCITLYYAPSATKSKLTILSTKVTVKATRSLTLVSFERVSLVWYVWHIFCIILLKYWTQQDCQQILTDSSIPNLQQNGHSNFLDSDFNDPDDSSEKGACGFYDVIE